MDMTDLYRMYDAEGELMYIGISYNAAARAAQHAKDQPWWHHVARIDIEHLDCGRTEAERVEAEAIRREMPYHNKKGQLPWDYDVCPQCRDDHSDWDRYKPIGVRHHGRNGVQMLYRCKRQHHHVLYMSMTAKDPA
jgi:predicted GIY-YIG superfamily endonuclease